MPKLKTRPPKYSKLKQYAVVYSNRKIHYLGLYGSPESKTAYARFVAESRVDPIFAPPQEGEKITVSDLVAAFLDHVKPTLDDSTFGHYRTLIADFLLKLYGDDIAVDDFKPRSLKLVRSEMIQSQRFCRNTINVYTRRIVSIFGWGVSEELAPETMDNLNRISVFSAGSSSKIPMILWKRRYRTCPRSFVQLFVVTPRLLTIALRRHHRTHAALLRLRTASIPFIRLKHR